jgi:hypothetical protein
MPANSNTTAARPPPGFTTFNLSCPNEDQTAMPVGLIFNVLILKN